MYLFPIIYKTFELNIVLQKFVNGSMSRMYYTEVNFPHKE